MGAAGLHAAALHVDDLVGEFDGGAAVGDHDDGGCSVAFAQPGQDLRLDLRVHGRGGVVHDEQARAAYDGAGQGEALALSAGERGALLPEAGVQAPVEFGDESVGAGQAQGGPHLGVVDTGCFEGDVVADGVLEDEGALGDEGGVGGDLVAGQVAYVHPVVADGAVVGVDQAHEQGGEGGLARAGGADDGDGAAGGDVEVEAVEDGGAGVGGSLVHEVAVVGGVGVGVGEGEVAHAHGEAGGAVVEGAVAVGHGALGAQYGLHPVPADDAAGQVAQEPAEGADGLRQEGEQERDLDEVAGFDGAGAQAPHAQEQDGEHAEVGQHLHEGVEHRAQAPDPDEGVAQAVGGVGEAFGLGVLAAEGLDDEGAVEGFVGDAADLGAQGLGAGGQG